MLVVQQVGLNSLKICSKLLNKTSLRAVILRENSFLMDLVGVNGKRCIIHGWICYIAEAKLGGMLKGIEKKRKKQSSTQRTSLHSLPKGITKKESYYAQTIAEVKG